MGFGKNSTKFSIPFTLDLTDLQIVENGNIKKV